jgi:hypothetical protein
MATATETPDLTILDALTRYLEGKVLQAKKEDQGEVTISTVDVQTRVASRCREQYGVHALPATWSRKFRILRNDPARLSEIGIEDARPVPNSDPLTIRFSLDGQS